jgi:outer membrane protein OmpA-like peptidoglycan-associated protein
MGAGRFPAYILPMESPPLILNATFERTLMKTQPVTIPRLLSALALLAGSVLPSAAVAQTDVDPPKTEAIGPNTDIKVITPTNTFYGTRGLTQTGSAEALGEGRLLFGVNGAWYQQGQAPVAQAPDNPQKGANIFTGIGAASFGISPYIDAFASMSVYGSTNYEAPASASSTGSGLGALRGGIQGTLPFRPSTPIRMAGQAVVSQGLSSNPVNTFRADGYNYFETRTGMDFSAKLLQTMVFGSEDGAFKMHFNEGVVTSTEAGKDPLVLLAAAMQFNMPVASLGLEINSRTSLKDVEMSTDPLWVTPSVQLRTAYSMNATLGADISLSQARAGDAPRALEPYRLFGGMTFSFDTQAAKRQRIKDEERRKALEAEQLKRSNRNLAENAAQSDAAAAAAAAAAATARARQKASADSLAALTSKSKQDSAAMASKARQDSLALADAARKLAEEKSKRSDAEKQLLSTGLLLMDAVYFETGKTDISINSKPYLNIIAKMLVKYPKLQIQVAGHTDNVGGSAYNMGLSQGRAQAVRDYMVMVAPELSAHLSAMGYGMTMPKASNATAAGKTLNRRTELQVLNKDALREYNR